MMTRQAKHRAARALVAAVPAALLATAAAAHTGQGVAGVGTGLLHPLTGPDHVAAMLAVGLWAALLGGRAVWMLPVAFPLAMAVGGVMGMEAIPLPAVETGIALSGIVLGLLVAFAVRAPVWVSVAIVGAFALFHGHAHGAELPAATHPAAYAGGFLAATAALHLAGIGLGRLVPRPGGALAVRGAGAAVAAVGAAFLFGLA